MADSRRLRRVALEHGLDPDTTPPEDLLLFETDENGTPMVEHDYKRAVVRLRREAKLAAMGGNG